MINKDALITDLAERTGFTKKNTKLFIEAFLELMKEYMFTDKKVKIKGFFTAEVKELRIPAARNPKTNERLDLPPCKKIKIKISKTLNKEVNERLSDR